MIRTQIQLTEEQARRLRDAAAREGRSMADIVRESLEEYLGRGPIDREELERRARSAVGRFRSDVPDLGKEHDRYAAEAYEDS